jgi:DNA-binding response OmpR family regulator
MSILVVEDDPLFRDAVISVLQMQGYAVDWAASAAEATQKARQRNYQLLVSDIRISGDVDGVEGLAQIRLIQPDIRCILMTGYADIDAPMRAARLQADDYLLKPFKLHALTQSVQQVLDKDTGLGELGARLDTTDAAARWLFDQRLQELEVHREACLQQYFVLIRSKRLKQSEAYAFFCAWEEAELAYIQQPGPQNWARHRTAYQNWERALNRLEVPQQPSLTLDRGLFDLLFARIQSGVLQVHQLLQAIRLLHDPQARKENLQAYCTYHWLWADQLDQGDPFLGLTLKGYRLLRHRSVPSPLVRLYEAKAEIRPKSGDMVLCLPESEDWQGLLSTELRAERASLMSTTFGHHFLLYPGYSLSLKARLPTQGVSYRQAWKILRPVFQQVAMYHQQGRFSGCFSLRDIDSPPGQPCSLSHFSPAAYREAHRLLVEAEGAITDFKAAPEVLHQPEPTAASDQAVLGRLIYEVIHGGRYPEPSLPVHIRMLGQPESNRAFAPYLQRLGPLTPLFYRMAQADPAQRFPNLEDAVAAVDALLLREGS